MTPSNGWKLMANRERHEKTIPVSVLLSPTTSDSHTGKKRKTGCHDEKSRERRTDRKSRNRDFYAYLQNSLFLPSRDNIEKQDGAEAPYLSSHSSFKCYQNRTLRIQYGGAESLPVPAIHHWPQGSDSSRQVICAWYDRLHQPPGGPGDQ